MLINKSVLTHLKEIQEKKRAKKMIQIIKTHIVLSFD